MYLPPLYHWSPIERRKRINRYGLRPLMPPTISTNSQGWRQPAVCLSSSPARAWSLSGGIFAAEGSVWDCWQVWLDDSDELHTVPGYGRELHEFRVHNRIHKSRIWHVGSRVAGKGRNR